MSYYDNVKDNVKDKDTNSAGKPSFDTLKEAAEETSVEEEEETDDGTPIEVLEEGGLRQENTTSSQKERNQNKSQSSSDVVESQADNSQKTGQSADISSIEQKLDKMIEQNQKIIEVLESFGQ